MEASRNRASRVRRPLPNPPRAASSSRLVFEMPPHPCAIAALPPANIKLPSHSPTISLLTAAFPHIHPSTLDDPRNPRAKRSHVAFRSARTCARRCAHGSEWVTSVERIGTCATGVAGPSTEASEAAVGLSAEQTLEQLCHSLRLPSAAAAKARDLLQRHGLTQQSTHSDAVRLPFPPRRPLARIPARAPARASEAPSEPSESPSRPFAPIVFRPHVCARHVRASPCGLRQICMSWCMRHPLECLRACAALPPTFVCVLPCVQGTGTLLLRYACGAVPVQMCTHFGSAVTSGAAARRELKMRKSIVWLQGAGTALVGCIAYLAIKLSAAAEGVAAQGGATKGNLVGLIREQTRKLRPDTTRMHATNACAP